MTMTFSYQGSAARIVFGRGTSAEVGKWVETLGCRRVLVLSTPHQAGDAEALSQRLGALSAGVFTDATMHTPVEVSERAVARADALQADCVVSLGGGSTTGLGKAMALRTDIAQIVVPTTYAGSEVTPILGQTENGVKATLRSPKVLPEVVIYDPDLTLGLPVGMSVTSGLNAIAHAAEGLYAPDRNPITTMMAIEGMRALRQSAIRGTPPLAKRPCTAPGFAARCSARSPCRCITSSAIRSAVASTRRMPRRIRSCLRIRSVSMPKPCRKRWRPSARSSAVRPARHCMISRSPSERRWC